MRFITMAILLAFTGNLKAQIINPFLSLKFDKVIVCDFENDGEHDYPLVNEKGQLTNIVKKSAQLDKVTISKLITKLGDKQSYGQGHAECFEPHFGVIFYKGAKEVAEVQICLSCNVLSSTLTIPAQKQGKAGHGKDVYYNLDGMSKQFRGFINGLIKQYNFSHAQAD
jgi:hypothetical protein